MQERREPQTPLDPEEEERKRKEWIKERDREMAILKIYLAAHKTRRSHDGKFHVVVAPTDTSTRAANEKASTGPPLPGRVTRN